MLIGVLSLMSYQLVDSAFIGQLGLEPLAAQGFTVPMYQVIIGFQVGLGIATTAVISQALGADKPLYARQLGTMVIAVGALVIACLCMGIWLLRGQILQWLGAETTLTPIIDQYWSVWLLSAFIGAMLYFGYSICRANGNTLLPGILMVITSLLNMVLDPLFIFYFELGLPGAAWATCCAFGAGCLVVFPAIWQRQWLTLCKETLNIIAAIKALAGVTGPAMMSQFMPAISAMLATGMVAAFGSEAVAAWGMGTRLDFFSIVIILALTMSLPPMVGRLKGAGNWIEIEQLVNIALQLTLLWQVLVALGWFAASGFFSDILAKDAQVSDILQHYLQRLPWSYGPLGVCMIMVSVCNAIGAPMRALLISCLRLFVCFLPALWIGAQWAGFDGLMIGAVVGNILAGIVSWRLYRQTLEKQKAGAQQIATPAKQLS